MGQVVFIGLGLDSEMGISLEGLEEARGANRVFGEFYTNIMPNLSMDRLEEMVGKKVLVLNRTQVEDENAAEIVKAAEQERVAFLVPGDPMIGTTHIALRIALAKRGIGSRLVHAASIVSAICGATGLQSFKFGKSITLPNVDRSVPTSVLGTVRENRTRGLHTLLLLDVRPDEEQLTISEALKRLCAADVEIDNWLGVGAARIGSASETVRAGIVKKLKSFDFGGAPHSIVFPGKLHFMEAEALKVLFGAEESDLEGSV